MSVTYEILKRLVKAANIKKRWIGMSTEELLDSRRRANAKNRIPVLHDDAFEISEWARPALQWAIAEGLVKV